MLNAKYSFKDFTGRNLADVDPAELSGTEIVGSCFYHDWHDHFHGWFDPWPKGMTDVTFRDCNLDNVLVPEGCTIIGGTHKMIRVQNDLEDWHCDQNEKPVVPVHKNEFIAFGLSIDPKDIPSSFVREHEVSEEEHASLKGGGVWFYEKPTVLGSRLVTKQQFVPLGSWNSMSRLDRELHLSSLKSKSAPKVMEFPNQGTVVVQTDEVRVRISGRGPMFINGDMGPCLNRSVLQMAMEGKERK